MSAVNSVELIILLFLILASAFFNGAETALISLNRIQLHRMIEEGLPGTSFVQKLLKMPSNFLTTILTGVTIVNIGASSLATLVAIRLFGATGAGIATGIVTLLVLVFGEITPKTFATQHAEGVSRFVARYIYYLTLVAEPLIKILNFFSRALIRLLGVKGRANGSNATEEEIRVLLNVGRQEGLIEEEEREMIDSIFDFDDTTVREVMVPRIDVIAVSADVSFDELLDLVLEVGHSRIPVYRDTIDNIIGVVYAKDLLRYVRDGYRVQVEKIMRSAYYIPETKKTNDLLQEFQKSKIHIAIILDEYGGTAGLVTIEDLLEEIVGEIQDEFDAEDVMIETLEDGSLRVDGRVSIDDLNEVLEIDLPDEQYETVNGLVFTLLGHIPMQGERLELDDLLFNVEQTEGHRSSKILIRKKDLVARDVNN